MTTFFEATRPWRRLAAAMIQLAVLDLKKKQYAEKAKRWFESKSQEDVLPSFAWCCEMLNCSPEYIRARALSGKTKRSNLYISRGRRGNGKKSRTYHVANIRNPQACEYCGEIILPRHKHTLRRYSSEKKPIIAHMACTREHSTVHTIIREAPRGGGPSHIVAEWNVPINRGA